MGAQEKSRLLAPHLCPFCVLLLFTLVSIGADELSKSFDYSERMCSAAGKMRGYRTLRVMVAALQDAQRLSLWKNIMSAFYSTLKISPLFIRLPFIVWVFGVTLLLLASPRHALTQPSFMDNFRKVMDRPGDLTRPLQQARLAKDLPSALESLPAMLRNSGIEVIPKTPGTEVRLGAKMVPVEGQVWWKHFEGAKQRPWIDVIEFKDEESAKRIFDQRGQWHSGAKFPDYFVFTTL